MYPKPSAKGLEEIMNYSLYETKCEPYYASRIFFFMGHYKADNSCLRPKSELTRFSLSYFFESNVIYLVMFVLRPMILAKSQVSMFVGQS